MSVLFRRSARSIASAILQIHHFVSYLFRSFHIVYLFASGFRNENDRGENNYEP